MAINGEEFADEVALDSKAHSKYPDLTEAEVKTLVIDDKWLAALDAETVRATGVTWRRAHALIAIAEAALAGALPSDAEALANEAEAVTALLRLPLNLLPTFIVPLVIATHVLITLRLRGARVPRWQTA